MGDRSGEPMGVCPEIPGAVGSGRKVSGGGVTGGRSERKVFGVRCFVGLGLGLMAASPQARLDGWVFWDGLGGKHALAGPFAVGGSVGLVMGLGVRLGLGSVWLDFLFHS